MEASWRKWRIGADFELFSWAIHELNELIVGVLHVIEGEAGIDARGGEDLEEGVVLGVGGVVVAGGVKKAAAEPGFRGGFCEAVSGFDGDGSGVLVEVTPLAVLEDSPKEKVEGAGLGWDGGDDVCTVGADADVLVVEGADGGGAVVGFSEAGAAIVIADAKDAEEEVVFELALGVSHILDVDVKLGVGIHVEDALGRTANHGGDVPGALAVVRIDAVEGALGIREAEVANEALTDAIGLKPGEGGVLWGCFLAFEELEATDAKAGVGAFAAIAKEALAEALRPQGGCCCYLRRSRCRRGRVGRERRRRCRRRCSGRRRRCFRRLRPGSRSV